MATIIIHSTPALKSCTPNSRQWPSLSVKVAFLEYEHHVYVYRSTSDEACIGIQASILASWIPQFIQSFECHPPHEFWISPRWCAYKTDKGDVIRQHNGYSGIYPTPQPSWIPEFIKRHSPYECRNSSIATTLLNSRFSLAHPGPQVLLFQLKAFMVALS